MKIIRFVYLDQIYYGELHGDEVILWSDAPWAGGLKLKKKVLFKEVNLLSPCQPGKIIAIAINYPGATGLKKEMVEPLVFFKPPSSVIGHNQSIVSPFSDTPTWGECELGIVVAEKLSPTIKVKPQNPIFGYTIANDVSTENVQGWDHHLARSKGADTFCALGPWIDTNFQPDSQKIQGYHNDSILREGRLSDRLWKESDLLTWLSSWITLNPGDVILTGTPKRVRDRQYLDNGDYFKCTIDGLGELINPYKYLHV